MHFEKPLCTCPSNSNHSESSPIVSWNSFRGELCQMFSKSPKSLNSSCFIKQTHHCQCPLLGAGLKWIFKFAVSLSCVKDKGRGCSWAVDEPAAVGRCPAVLGGRGASPSLTCHQPVWSHCQDDTAALQIRTDILPSHVRDAPHTIHAWLCWDARAAPCPALCSATKRGRLW